MLTTRVDRSIDEHRAMVKAVRSGDLDRVKETFELHIQRSYLSLAEHLAGEPRSRIRSRAGQVD